MGDPGREAHLAGVLRYAFAAASLGAGLIHVSAVFDHFGHPWVVAFFVVLALVQAGWAVAVMRRPTARLLQVGAAVSAGVVGVWLLSRITGLPGVPGAEGREAFGLKDGMASLLELLLVAGIGAQLAAPAQARRVASGRLASGLAVTVVGVLTATGLSAAGHGHDGGAGHDHPGSSAAAGDHGQAGEAAHGHGSDVGTGDHHAPAGHDAGSHGHDDPAHRHDAGSAGQSAAGHGHEAVPGHAHADGRDHHSSSFALAAGANHGGAADHDHDAPGHVHDPSHHHDPGHVHDPSHHHDPGHVHDPSHHHAPGHVHDPSHHHHQDGGQSDAASGPAEADGGRHDHEPGGHADPGHDHGDGHHDDPDACTSPFPANQVVTTVQEAAQSTLGVGCQIESSSPTADPHRHSPLRRGAEHFIS